MPPKLKLFIQSHFRLTVIIVGLVLLAGSGVAAYVIIRQNAIDKEATPSGEAQDGGSNGSNPTKDNKSKTESQAEKPGSAANKPGVANNNGTSGGPSSAGGSSNSTGGTSPQPGGPGGGGPTVPQTNCIVKPSACGYPDETNTGYQHTGVTLTTDGININHEGDFIITQDNTVIDSKRIDGCVIIKAKNVTIKRSLITNCQAYYNIWLQEASGGGIADTSNFLMEDVEVDGNQVFTNAAIVDDNGKGLTIRRMDMHDVADGPHPGENWLIEDSYIHDMYVCPNDCHTDSIQSAGAINVTIRHNTILNNPANNGTGGKNAVVRIATEQGPVSGFIVHNNLLDGGNYAVQVRSQGNGAPTGVVVTNNRIVPTWRFAPYDFTGIPLTLSGNFRDDTLEALDTSM